ncbi:hypothetical protein BIFCAT_00778 [Bifidobacterium catenulatum DSM 16992 = JCM 1194 = LMG 11043]|uniref:Uncharacterized protein n=1 Tax=Bifidobacterium catenulatum DSM 16992 = JCM 1194 = LMG 11043 TaxID=566552 RepID=B6XTL9_9BIFI|nr:hypothetical protein BIFCAT_00778 [Bifidobacterium catenulatum DSM 16992 = JCM 1194 = LMG 11043]
MDTKTNKNALQRILRWNASNRRNDSPAPQTRSANDSWYLNMDGDVLTRIKRIKPNPTNQYWNAARRVR